jgi:hypothetical protein
MNYHTNAKAEDEFARRVAKRLALDVSAEPVAKWVVFHRQGEPQAFGDCSSQLDRCHRQTSSTS